MKDSLLHQKLFKRKKRKKEEKKQKKKERKKRKELYPFFSYSRHHQREDSLIPFSYLLILL
jgi:hypothetical protein